MSGVGCWMHSLGSLTSCNGVRGVAAETHSEGSASHLWPDHRLEEKVLKR